MFLVIDRINSITFYPWEFGSCSSFPLSCLVPGPSPALYADFPSKKRIPKLDKIERWKGCTSTSCHKVWWWNSRTKAESLNLSHIIQTSDQSFPAIYICDNIARHQCRWGFAHSKKRWWKKHGCISIIHNRNTFKSRSMRISAVQRFGPR